MVSLCYKVGLSTDRSNELNKDQSPIVSFSIDSEPFRTVSWLCSNSASSVIQSTLMIPNEDSMTINNKMFLCRSVLQHYLWLPILYLPYCI